MTRRDYVRIAEALRRARFGLTSEWQGQARIMALRGWRESAAEIADSLASENPRFDRARFYAACGMDGAA